MQTPLLEEAPALDDEHSTPALSSGLSLRNVGISMVLGILLFLQGINISGLTTIQGAVATDLNALSKASWLISSYVVCSPQCSAPGGMASSDKR